MTTRYLILLCLFASGCLGMNTTRKLTSDIQQGFTNRFDHHRTVNLSDKIDIKGFYRYWFRDRVGQYQTTQNKIDTAFMDVLFYDDGTFLRNVWLPKEYSNYDDYFGSVISRGKKDDFYESYWWGIYSVSGDTIKAEYIMHASKLTPWYSGEDWYLIKGKNLLQLILSKTDVGQSVTAAQQTNGSHVKSATPAIFNPLKQIPAPYAWIKNEKFFWQDERDWDQYMKSYQE